MTEDTRLARFEEAVLVHLDAGYNLARWLLDDEAAAQDCVQEACIKALGAFETRTGPSTKAWFMAVVRNTALDALRCRRRRGPEDSYEDEVHGAAGGGEPADRPAERASDASWVRREIERLPVEFREVIVLRELEELSYKEISAIVKIPIGTVMSRLSRGRDLLAARLRMDARSLPG